MVLLLALPVFAAVTLAHRYLQLYAPSNMLIRYVRSAPPRWGTALVLAALATVLVVAMHAVAQAVEHGALRWLNLVVLVLAWDAIKVAWLAVWVALRGVTLAGRQLARRL